jgi:hypothetical protein
MLSTVAAFTLAATAFGAVTAPLQASAAPRRAALTRAGRTPRKITALYYFMNYNDSKRCLGIARGLAGLYNCTYKHDQVWKIIAHITYKGITFYQYENERGQCLGVAGSSKLNGARIVGQDCDDEVFSQYWYYDTYVTCTNGVLFSPFFNYWSRKAMGVHSNSSDNGAHVIQWSYQGKCNNQFWDQAG